MGLSRRFQNLIVDCPYSGAKSLLCVDLTRKLFGDTAAARTSSTIIVHGSESAKNKQVLNIEMSRIRLPSPSFTFQAALNERRRCKIDCFPLADRKTLWADHLDRPLLFDPEMHEVEIMAPLLKPKSNPLSLFVPNAEADKDYENYCRGSSLFLMERAPYPELEWSTPWSEQFEAFVYCNPASCCFTKSWLWQQLPPPPCLRERKHWIYGRSPEIISYALLLGSHICISIKGVGTYCLDTAIHTWAKLGNWTLPFHGRVEYVPELNLWFGFTSDESPQYLAAADLSSAMDMDFQPQLVTTPWKEELLDNLPEEWKECKDSQLVNLGSGRFCILRFFHTHSQKNEGNIAVFTGVEVLPRVQDANGGSAKLQLQMIPHKSLFHQSKDITIDAVL